MGRHSRRGKADIPNAEDTSGIPDVSTGNPSAPGGNGPAAASRRRSAAPPNADGAYGAVPAPASYAEPGGPAGAPVRGERSWPASTPEHGTPQDGSPPHGAVPPGGQARGGHPQQPEDGGYPESRPAYGGYGGGQAPNAGPNAGPRTGSGARRRGRGPRQEYLDAFDGGVSAPGTPAAGQGGTPGAWAPASGAPVSPPFGVPGQRQAPPGTRPPGYREEHRADGDGERPRTGVPGARDGAPDEAGIPPGAGTSPGRRGSGEPPEGDPLAPLAPIPPPEEKGGKGRTFTGIAAAAVTTVLAFTVAAQVTGGHHGQDGSGRGVNTGERSADADHATDEERADRADRTTSGKARPQPLSYDAKMAKRYPLADDFKGSGRFSTLAGHEKGPGKGRVVRYRVDIEQGLPLESELFAQAVHKTLNDERSWAHDGDRRFERVSTGRADFVITLASPHTTDVWCAKSGLDTSQEKVSCDSATTERVMINAYRWARGASTFGPEQMHAYRQMLINHEVGHRLGHGHVGCAKDGALAPVMMQQTKFLSTDGATCKPNAWPHPRG